MVSRIVCKKCFGLGFLIYTSMDVCPDCNGKGYYLDFKCSFDGKKYSSRIRKFYNRITKGKG